MTAVVSMVSRLVLFWRTTYGRELFDVDFGPMVIAVVSKKMDERKA
jgi:hypothetical protein